MDIDERIIRFLDTFCVNNDYSYHPHYSGRFMFGEHCVGVSGVSQQELFLSMIQFAATYDTDGQLKKRVKTLLIHSSVDQMGNNHIFYFKSLKSPNAVSNQEQRRLGQVG